MSNQHIVLYQDVDGVLNVMQPHPTWHSRSQQQHIFTPNDGETYRVRWSPKQMDALRALDLSITWATTWTNNAPELLGPLWNYGENRRYLVPPEGYDMDPSIHWKWAAIQVDQELRPSPFVWLDDEHTDLTRKWARDHGGFAPYLRSVFGVTPAEVEQIKRYIEMHPEEY